MSGVKFGHATDVGRERDHNEDNLCVHPDVGLWLVADGMGGHLGGEIASEIVVRHVPHELRNGASLTEAIASTHHAILDAPSKGQGERGMGSTVVAVCMTGNRYETAWVGDSRCYLWDGRLLLQLTHDHSAVQDMMDVGILTKEEAEDHADRNVVTQALGVTNLPEVKVDRITGRLSPGERLLLCSDGLTGEVSNDEIADIMRRNLPDQETVDALIRQANANGGSDNITVIVITLADEGEQPSGQRTTEVFVAVEPKRTQVHTAIPKKAPQRSFPKLSYVILLFILVALVIGYLIMDGDSTPSKSSIPSKPPQVEAPPPEGENKPVEDSSLHEEEAPVSSQEEESVKEPETGGKEESLDVLPETDDVASNNSDLDQNTNETTEGDNLE